jgi:BTB/POZ domain
MSRIKGEEIMQAESDTGYDESNFHPLFSSPEADVILGSKDGTLFRIHSFTLKTTSLWFRTMFSLPQKSDSVKPDVIHINVDEDAHTLECLLRMVCGLPILMVESYDTIDSLLYAAEKYDMPGPMSIIRVLVMTRPLVDQPLRLYGIACRFGWESEAKFASTQTLTYNLHDPEYRPLLQRLGTKSILDLFELHRTRRERLRQRLDDPPFVSGGMSTCHACGMLIDYHTWRELKYKIILEMDVRPLGDTIIDNGLLEWAESRACWLAKCTNPGCGRVLYDKTETLRVIKECIKGLPSCI